MVLQPYPLDFLEKNPDVKSFDIYRPTWKVLMNSAKFATITTTHSAAERDLANKRVANSSEGSPEDDKLVNPRPVDRKKAKRMQEEEHIIKNVAEKLKETCSSVNAG